MEGAINTYKQLNLGELETLQRNSISGSSVVVNYNSASVQMQKSDNEPLMIST